MEIKRYDLHGSYEPYIAEDKEGGYVKYDDYQTLEAQLQQYKEALGFACQRIYFHGHCCPAESVSNFNAFECKDICDMDNHKPFSCWMKYFLETKGGQ